MPITWDQITAECDGYRAGFVAVFRKYEGQPTNEKDGQGRTIKVTMRSFSEHVKVPATTFQQWVKQTTRVGSSATPWMATKPGTTRTGQMGRQIAKSPTTSVEDKLGMLKDLVSDRNVMKAYQNERTPVVSEHDAKAARAASAAFAHKVGQSFTGLEVPMWLDQLKEITDALAEYEFDEATINKLARAARKLMDEVEVQQFRLGLIEEAN